MLDVIELSNNLLFIFVQKKTFLFIHDIKMHVRYLHRLANNIHSQKIVSFIASHRAAVEYNRWEVKRLPFDCILISIFCFLDLF